MSDSSTPRPVAWACGGMEIGGDAHSRLVVVRHSVELHHGGTNTAGGDGILPSEAESRALALIMAAAVARGEPGHTPALNRVAKALTGGGVADGAMERLRADRDSCVGVIEQRWGELRDALHMAGDAPWGLLVDAAGRLRTDLASAEAALREAHAERDRLRAAANDAAVACGVATVRQVPDAWAALTADADAARGVLGGREGETVERAARRVVAERDTLRAELAEARVALSGMSQYDAAAEVVAPLREALCDVDDVEMEYINSESPSWVVARAVAILRDPMNARVASPKPTREPMTHTSLTSIEEHGVVVGDRVAWPGGVRDSVSVLGHLFELGAKSEGFNLDQWSGGRPFAITAVEAPDA